MTKANTGAPITQTMIDGSPIAAIHVRWSPENQPYSVCILILISSPPRLTHSNSPKVCFEMLGWSKNIVQITDIMTYLFVCLNQDGFSRYSTTQMNTNISIRMTGSNMVRNTLNIWFDGANALISVSSMNQSNDRKASEVEPRVSNMPNALVNELGNLKLNE